MHREPCWQRLSVFLILSLGPFLAAVPAQDEPSAVEKAYERTKSAETAEDFTQVLQLCQQAQAQDLSQQDQSYIGRLSAWAHNRRGEVRTELAAAALKQGDEQQAAQLDAQALADFEAAVQQDATKWKAYHNRGVSYALAGEYEKAIADFGRVIRLNSRYANAWFNRGEILYEQGQFTEAVRDYTQAIQLAIQLNRRDAGAYISRGHAYFRLRRFRESLNDYNQAVQLTPSSADSYANRGDAYQSLGMWAQAALDFRRAIDLDSESARAYQSAAWLMATCPDATYRNTELAVQAATRAIELLDQQDYRYLDTLAAAQANAGRFDEATATLSRAVEAAPQAEVAALQKRLKLYENAQPYRQDRSQPETAADRELSGSPS